MGHWYHEERGTFCYELEMMDMLKKVAFLGCTRICPESPLRLGMVLLKVQTQHQKVARGPGPCGECLQLLAVWDQNG